MNNSRKVNGNLNVVGNKIKYYRESNNLSYQKLFFSKNILFCSWFTLYSSFKGIQNNTSN